MTRREEIADVLDGAADVIERDGWFKVGASRYTDGIGAACALVAIHRAGAVSNTDWFQSICALTQSIGIGFLGVPDWNNAPERTKQEVLDALRLAAKHERRLADAEDGAA